MSKTLNFCFLDQNGNPYSGVSADSHFVYNLMGGLPKYSLIVLTVGCVAGAGITIASQKVLGVLKKKYLEKPVANNDPEPND